MRSRQIETHNNATKSQTQKQRKNLTGKAKAIVISADSFGGVFDGQHRMSFLADYFREVRPPKQATKRAIGKTKRH